MAHLAHPAHFDTVLNTAHFWQSIGVATLPVKYREKTPDARLLPHGKWEWLKNRLPTDAELSKWFGGGFHNIGIVVGWQNLVVIDFDDLAGYIRWSMWIARRPLQHRIIRHTLKIQTARGVHVYLITQQPAQNAKLDRIDIKARNGYVLAPPSIHPSGAIYTVMEGSIPMPIQNLSDVLPGELLAQHTEYAPVVNTQAMPAVTVADDPWGKAEQPYDLNRDLIQQLKGRFRIEQLLNIDEKRNARWSRTRCPFHDDKKPSMWVDMNNQLCGCFAGCTRRPYDVIDLYARLHNLTVPEAIRLMVRL